MPTARTILLGLVALWGVILLFVLFRPTLVAMDETACVSSVIVVAAVVLLVVYFVRQPGPDRVPDVLGEQFGEYFDQHGFSFAPRLAGGTAGAGDSDSTARFLVAYHNRYAGRCVARVVCWPVDGWSKTGAHEVPPVTLTVTCAGGEAGVVEVPYPIARAWQGREMIYDLACSADFPDGGGARLSAGRGLKVGRVNAEAWEPLVTGALLLTGHLRFSSPASVRVVLPAGVAETVPPGAAPSVTIMYPPAPDAAVGGSDGQAAAVSDRP